MLVTSGLRLFIPGSSLVGSEHVWLAQCCSPASEPQYCMSPLLSGFALCAATVSSTPQRTAVCSGMLWHAVSCCGTDAWGHIAQDCMLCLLKAGCVTVPGVCDISNILQYAMACCGNMALMPTDTLHGHFTFPSHEHWHMTACSVC